MHKAIPDRKECIPSMFPGRFVRDSDVAEEDLAPRREQRTSPRRLLRRSRVCLLLVLTLFGLHLLAAGSGAGNGTILSIQHASPGHASVQTSLAARPGITLAVGMGAGASSNERMGATAPAAVCLNPLDVTCWLQNAAQWVAQQIINALQPVINAILKSPLNIITQTPPADTYQNPTVSTWCSAFLTVVDLALKLGLVLNINEDTLQCKTPTFSDLREMAQVAEQVGFDSLWLADHLIFRSPGQAERGAWEAFTMLGALAAVTQYITLGPLVACTSFREPALLAKMADTLDEISNGRSILGLGAGWYQPEYEAFGYPFDHLGGRFAEALQVIVPLLREGQVDFTGQYYRTRNCVLRPRGPSASGPSILIGASRPRMLQLVAQFADAWNTVWHIDPALVKERYDEFKQICLEVGRDPATIEMTAGTIVHIPQSTQDDPSEKAISGTPEEIANRLQGFANVGVTHLMVAMRSSSVTSIEQFGRVIELLH